MLQKLYKCCKKLLIAPATCRKREETVSYNRELPDDGTVRLVCCNIVTLIQLRSFVGSNRNKWIVMYRMENVKRIIPLPPVSCKLVSFFILRLQCCHCWKCSWFLHLDEGVTPSFAGSSPIGRMQGKSTAHIHWLMVIGQHKGAWWHGRWTSATHSTLYLMTWQTNISYTLNSVLDDMTDERQLHT